MKRTQLTILLLGITCPLSAQDPPTGRIEALVEAAYADHDFPSLSVGIVDGSDLAWARSLGMADLEHQRRATPRTLYLIGSVTKVFTTTLMATLRDEGRLRLDDPIKSLLPDDVRLPHDPRGDPEITLEHLATHTSGLSMDPANLRGGEDDPWGGYTVEQLYQELATASLQFPIGADIQYSNTGMGLLGLLLERAGGKPYETLLVERLLDPLDMHDTRITLSADQQARFATGYLPGLPPRPAVPWTLGCLQGCGALASTVEDLAKWISFQFRTGEAALEPVSGASLLELHRPHRLLPDWTSSVALGWMVDRNDQIGDVVRHNGGMSGHRSHVSFSPTHEVGVIVLVNQGHDEASNPVAELGRQLLPEAIAAYGMDPVRKAAEALMPHFNATPGKELGGLFHPEFLVRIPLQAIADEFRSQFRDKGRCLEIVSLTPHRLLRRGSVTFRFERGELHCELEVDAQGRLLYLRLD